MAFSQRDQLGNRDSCAGAAGDGARDVEQFAKRIADDSSGTGPVERMWEELLQGPKGALWKCAGPRDSAEAA